MWKVKVKGKFDVSVSQYKFLLLFYVKENIKFIRDFCGPSY